MNEPFLDLPSYLAFLDRSGRLQRVRAEVDKDTELACIARWALEGFTRGREYALVFERVRGHSLPVAVHVFPSLDLYATAIGTPLSGVYERWSAALAGPVPPRIVDAAPVHDVVLTGDDADLTALPVPVWTPGRDAGPYLSAGLVITRDPDTGVQNLANYRIQIHDRRCAGLFFGSDLQHGAMHRARYRRRNEAMPVALVVGAPPAVNFAAAAKTAYGIDEMSIAGALSGAPIEVVRCRTNDLLVPARAEIVIEGRVAPDASRMEGPFGEALGYMNDPLPAPFIDVTAVCRRREAVFHGYVQQLPPSDGHLVMEMGVLGPLWYYLTRKLGVRGLRDLAIARGAAGVSMLLVQLDRTAAGQAGPVGRALARLNFGQKFVCFLDDDVDLRDPEAVNWAITSRVDPDRDFTLHSDTHAFQYDPSTLDRARAKGRAPSGPPYESSLAVIDATLKGPAPPVCLPDAALMRRVIQRWSEWGLPPIAARPRIQTMLDAAEPPDSRPNA